MIDGQDILETLYENEELSREQIVAFIDGARKSQNETVTELESHFEVKALTSEKTLPFVASIVLAKMFEEMLDDINMDQFWAEMINYAKNV